MNKIIVDLGDVSKERALSLIDILKPVEDRLAGYRVGSLLVYENSIKILETMRGRTNLSIIFDGEKLATGSPEIIWEQVHLLAPTGINQIVGCPIGGGSETLESFAIICFRYNIVPVLEIMTHPGANAYLKRDSLEKILREAREIGITHFIFPGSQAGIELLEKQKKILEGVPGLVLKAAEFRVHVGWTKKLKDLGVTEFIVDRAVCAAPDPVEAVKDLFKEINKSD